MHHTFYILYLINTRFLQWSRFHLCFQTICIIGIVFNYTNRFNVFIYAYYVLSYRDNAIKHLSVK